MSIEYQEEVEADEVDAEMEDALGVAEEEETPAEPDGDGEGNGDGDGEADENGDVLIEVDGETEAEGEREVENDLEEAGAAAKNEEELQRKRTAMDSLNSIEQYFAVFRDRLFEERIAALDAEIETLKGAQPTHHEYVLIEEVLDNRRDEKIELENKLLEYRFQSVLTRSKAERAQIHSQYFQTARQIRETMLAAVFDEATQLRRGWEGVIPDYYKAFPTKRSEQIVNQMAYNKEVSILAGIAKYKGFPAAPSLWTVKRSDVDKDLKAMGLE